MPRQQLIAICLSLLLAAPACKKDDQEHKLVPGQCYKGMPVYRILANKEATVRVDATAIGIYLVEKGTIDTKLIPCNLPKEYLQNGLEVIISGRIHQMPRLDGFPCCTQSLDLTAIRRP